jgi:hypothetical protein
MKLETLLPLIGVIVGWSLKTASDYGPHQVAEMVRYAEQMRSARSFLPVIEYENPFSAGSDLGPHNPL